MIIHDSNSILDWMVKTESIEGAKILINRVDINIELH